MQKARDKELIEKPEVDAGAGNGNGKPETRIDREAKNG